MERTDHGVSAATRTLMLAFAVPVIVLGFGFTLQTQWISGLLGLDLGDGPTAKETLRLFRLMGLWLGSSGVLVWFFSDAALTRGRRTFLLCLLGASTLIWIGTPVLWVSEEDPILFLFYPYAFCITFFVVVFPGTWSLGRGSAPGLATIDPARAEAAQEERNRLARDLHDSIKQQLFSIKTSAAAAEARWDNDPAGARHALLDIRKSSHEAMVEMQALLLQLRPVALANVGLVEALREQCEALGYRSGAQVDFGVGQLPDENRLPQSAQETLFRIAQEALSNVARHSRATRVRVWLGEVEAEGIPSFVLCIEDNGQGFNLESETSGMGLRNLRERLEMLDGTLKVESSPGHGTRIDVILPTPHSQGASSGFDMAVIACLALLPGERPTFWIPLIGGALALLEAVQRRRRSVDSIPWKLWWRRHLGHYYLFFSFAIAFWGSPLFHRAGEPTWGIWDGLLLVATILAAMAATTEAIFLLWSWGQASFSRAKTIAARRRGDPSTLVIAAAGFLITLPLLLVMDGPGIIGRAAMVASGLLYLAYWVKLTFR